MLAYIFENIEGDSLDNISLEEYSIETFTGDHGYLLDGYCRVIEEIAKPLQKDATVRLEHIVDHVDYTKDGSGMLKKSLKGHS